MKLWTKIASFLMAGTMAISCFSFAAAESTPAFNDVPLQFTEKTEADADYYQTLWKTGMYNLKMVRNLPTLFDADAWDASQSSANLLASMDPANLTDANKAVLTEVNNSFKSLLDHQVKPYAGIDGEVLYIWDDHMPTTTEDVASKFTTESYDNSGFRPFLVPFIQADQSNAKGTLIILSGGGNTTRSNPNEAYPITPKFFDLGYNCFILQRRVEPYNNTDIVMDLQRSIRFIKYHAPEWGDEY